MSLPEYDAYQPTPLCWASRIPAHWKVDRLKRSIVTAKNGIWGDEPQDDENDIACVRVADFDRVRLRAVLSDPTIRNVTTSERNGRVLNRGDLLLEKSGGGETSPVGCVVLYDNDEPAVCSNFVARVVVQPQMHPTFWVYIHRAIYAARINYRSIKQTSGIQNLDAGQYFDEAVPYPPRDEQHLIADFLDRETAKIDALVAEQERLMALLREKRQTVISQAVTKGLDPDAPLKASGVEWLGDVPAHWMLTRLKWVTDAVVDCPHETPEYSDDGAYLVVRTADVNEGYLATAGMRRVDQAEYSSRIRRAALHKDDIVYGREGERWGHAALVPQPDLFCLGQRMMQFRPASAVVPAYLMRVLNSDAVYQQGAVDTVGATSPHVNVGTIRNFTFPLPPLLEQQQIAENLDEWCSRSDALIDAVVVAIERLHERRAALISAAVTGQIDVRKTDHADPDTANQPAAQRSSKLKARDTHASKQS